MLTLIAQQLDFYQAATQQGLPGVPANVATTADRGFGNWLGNLLSAIMIIAALLLLLYLVWGAIDWLTSAGESSKVQKARDKMTQAVIGMLVLAASLAIFFLVQDVVGITFFKLTGTSGTSAPTSRTGVPATSGSAPVGGTLPPTGNNSGKVPVQGSGTGGGQPVPASI